MLRLAWLSAFVMACGATPASTASDASAQDAAPPPDVAPALDLGTGLHQWEPLDLSPTPVELVHGPQGGYHVYARVRVSGLAPDVNVSFSLRAAGGATALNDTQPLRRRDRMGLVRAGDSSSSAPELVILTTIRSPDEVVGMQFTLDAAVQEYPMGRVLTTSRRITIVDNEP